MDVSYDAVSAPLGRRARNKLRTRKDIATATIRLADTVGLEHVTVEQIAAAADVAPRTFFRYFDSKEDAVLADHLERRELLRKALEARPVSEGALTAVRSAIMDVALDLDAHRELILCKSRLMENNPSLRGRSLEVMGELENMIAESLATRARRARVEFQDLVIAAAVCTAMRVAVDRWASSGGDGDLIAMVTSALDLLDGGLNRPTSQ